MNEESSKQKSAKNHSDEEPSKSDELLISEVLKQKIPELSDPDISEENKADILRTIISASISKSSTFSGPLPPPELLKGYNEILQDGAERIVAMAEKQSAHRIQLEDHAIKEELKQSRNGQLFGFILGLTGLCLATFLAMFGHEMVAGIFGTTTIIGLVTVFVLGKKAQQKNLSEKEEE